MPYIEVIRKNGKQGARVAPCFFVKKAGHSNKQNKKTLPLHP
jgi:hypothetical protein